MKRIVAMIGRGTRKDNTEFGAEDGPVLGKGIRRRSGPGGGGNTGTDGDVYSKQEKMQERE